MGYVRYEELAGRPNVVVDGSGTEGTLLTLSHWPHSGTPTALKADLSAEIAFRYLDDPALAVDAELVSNNHLDEDGVVGIYALVAPEHALEHRRLLIEAARLGDFSCTHSLEGARLGFAIGALVQEEGDYEGVLDALPDVIDDLDGNVDLWEPEDVPMREAAAAIGGGAIEIEEHRDLDLTIVTFREPVFMHPVALYNVIEGFCVLQFQPQPRIDYRYESWVQYVSRPVRARRDLRPLADRLSELDSCEWHADAPGDLLPACEPTDESTLDAGELREIVTSFLRDEPAAWDPYDEGSAPSA